MMWTDPTALMIGRFQPWHKGHIELLKAAVEEYGQVVIGIRSMPRSVENPYSAINVMDRVTHSVRALNLSSKVEAIFLPNVVSVVHGRRPGWTVRGIELPPDVELISATRIREGSIGVFS